MELFWSKAAPGLYYLWDRPMKKETGHVGKVWRREDGKYGAYFDLGSIGIRLPFSNTNPAGKIESLESAIFRLIPDVTFTREGF